MESTYPSSSVNKYLPRSCHLPGTVKVQDREMAGTPHLSSTKLPSNKDTLCPQDPRGSTELLSTCLGIWRRRPSPQVGLAEVLPRLRAVLWAPQNTVVCTLFCAKSHVRKWLGPWVSFYQQLTGTWDFRHFTLHKRFNHRAEQAKYVSW